MGETISQLLNKIQNEEIVLPEFQREFTWSRPQCKLLIDSLLAEYPTGSLLMWKTADPPALKNMPDFSPDGRVEVLLDGQQRLTVLYLLVKDEIPPYYSRISTDPRSLSYNLETGELKYYTKTEMQDDPRWVKVTKCFSDSDQPDPGGIVERLFDSSDHFKKYREYQNNLDHLCGIANLEYPIMYVREDSSLEQALTVFDRVNSQGTPLSEADIALAHMVSSWPETRRVFKAKLRELENEGFTFDLTFLVRGMNAVVNSRAEFEQIHDTTESELEAGWDELSRILDYLINILRHHAYIYSTADLNTPNVLIPIIGYLSQQGGEFSSASDRNHILYWMYGALILRRYSRSVDAYLAQDLNHLDDANPIEALIATLKEEYGDITVSPSNLDMRGVQHPLYNMMCIVIRSRGGVDWRNGVDLSEPYGSSYTIEMHHIFPRSQLQADGYDTGANHHDKKRVNEIANRVPLTKSGNIGIFNEKPSDYLPKVLDDYPNALNSHLVPRDSDLWQMERYEDFLAHRRELIAEGINEYLGELAPLSTVPIEATAED